MLSYELSPSKVQSMFGKALPSDSIVTTAHSQATALHHQLRDHIKSAAFHLKTLWLFIADDAKTIAPTWLCFSLIHATNLSQFGTSSLPISTLLLRLPHITTWVLLHLLMHDIGNQRRPTSVLEDTLNKPWRPIPAGRISAPAACTLHTVCQLTACLFSLRFGGLAAHLTILALSHVYNDPRGANHSWALRNLINGFGNIAYGYGALEVAVGSEHSLMTPQLASWLCMLGLAISSSSHIQDLKDQVGDAAAGMLTVPLVYGDGVARWSLVAVLVAWTATCCGIWATSVAVSVGPVLAAAIVVYRLLSWRRASEDRVTQKIWHAWILALYAVPAMSRFA